TGGTGLGLVLVREIVHAHGGVIHLAASERGARFEMELPWRASGSSMTMLPFAAAWPRPSATSATKSWKPAVLLPA
ncbi:ATP-binding protein, partial [Acinetobacter baumannii]